MSLVLYAGCAKNINVPREKAISGIHENGCGCRDLPKEISEYEFVGIVTVVDIEAAVEFCTINKLASDGAIALLELAQDETSIITADRCSCPGLPAEEMNSIMLVETQYLKAAAAVINECKQNLYNELEED